jgi:hypothetical protein
LKKEVAVERKQDTLEKSQARVQKLLELLKKSQERERQRCSRSKPRKKLLTPEQRGRRQRKYQRKYNRSPAGRARYRKWQESPQGRDARTRAYQERREWLDQVMGQCGCMICHEKNPLTLRLRVRPRERVPFSPESKNLSRSKKDWEEVIRYCDVICLNCLLKKEPRHKSGRPRKLSEMVREGSKISRESCVNATLSHDPEVPRPNPRLNLCRTCGAEFKSKFKPGSKRKQEFCSPRCRLLRWAIKEILKVYRAGQADGLKPILGELASLESSHWTSPGHQEKQAI